MRTWLAVVALLVASGCAPAAPVDPVTPAPQLPARAVPAGALDPMLRDFAYPFPVAHHQLRSQRQELVMAYVDVAPPAQASVPATGRVALLLHGKNFSAAYWAPTIRVLVAAGFRVIAPDQIGFGKSSKPERFQFAFEALAEHTRSLLDRLGVDQVTVIGHSMGGMLAVRFALMFPARTERLALINPIGLEDWRAHVPAATIDELYEKELAATPASIREYQRTAYYGGTWKPAYEPLTEILAGWTRHPEYPKVAWNAALTADMIFTQPVVHEFPRITVPTLLVIGQRDRTAIGKDRAPPDVAAQLGDYPTLGRRAAAQIPGARLVELPGVGHLPQVEAFDAYASALLEFLR
ncbi:MAG: alpha/beta hydrolase [Myxococcota bacterium]|nr:alpha/beta hydrolase [Myxococcota bacterium]